MRPGIRSRRARISHSFRHDLNFGQTEDPVLKAYRKDLLDAMAAADQVGVPESDIVAASVFTTQSATAVLEKIRDQIHAAHAGAGGLQRSGRTATRTVFDLSQVTGITFNQQTDGERVAQPTSPSRPLACSTSIPGAVGQVAFGKYVSPDY